MRTALPRWICLWCRPCNFGCSYVLLDHGAQPTAESYGLTLPHIQPPMASQPTHTSVWLGVHSELPDPRPDACYGSQFVRRASRHSRSSDISAFALAERLCGAPDRLDPPGMSRPCRCVRSAPPAACAAVIHGLLQHCSNPPIAGEGRAHPAPCARSRRHPTTARSRWTASSICPDLIYGRDRSIYDALGLEFTLLRLGLKMVERTRLVETAAKALGVPLSICRCGNEESPAVSGRSRLDPTGPDRCLARQFAAHVMSRLPDTSTLISALGENRRFRPGRVDVTGELCKSHALPAMPAEEASDETVERLRFTEGGLGPPTTPAMHAEIIEVRADSRNAVLSTLP